MSGASAKVRSIYDALDARNPKQAVKLCDATLKRSSIPLVRALKAVALERLGRADEATALARETSTAALKAPIDEHVLSTLMLVFKALGLADEGSAVYEAAWQVEPDNEELSSALFLAHLRTASFAKAQQLAMKMFKRPGGEEYVFWAVACIVLQVDEMGPPLQPTPQHYAAAQATSAGAKLLQIAAAMLARAASQGKLTTESHLRLYLEVLRRQDGAQKAERLALLSEHGLLLSSPIERLRLEAELLEGLGRMSEAEARHAEITREHAPDDWSSHSAQLRFALAESTDAAVQRVKTTLTHLQASDPKLRGPWLADLILQLTKYDRAAAEAAVAPGPRPLPCAPASAAPSTPPEDTPADAVDAADAKTLALDGLLDKLLAYFARYGERTACALDVLACLRALGSSMNAQDALISKLEALCVPSTEEAELSLRWLQRYTTMCQWRLSCGATLRMQLDERLAFAGECLKQYIRHKPLSADLDSRERGHADLLPLVSAQALLPRPTADWLSTRGDSVTLWHTDALVAAAIGLRMGLDASPHNFQLKLALISVLQCMGAPLLWVVHMRDGKNW